MIVIVVITRECQLFSKINITGRGREERGRERVEERGREREREREKGANDPQIPGDYTFSMWESRPEKETSMPLTVYGRAMYLLPLRASCSMLYPGEGSLDISA